ncbi:MULTISPECIES: YtxH domain-containing protein [unclassified Arthrobacter]|uniref:YtxH domain-containing protein n=1 Tax=unclassified Arthrobacter TaxID=235627 RepID=UPI001E57D3A6|nr:MULTISPECIES: YtxH domain-containing protein [unclassified Arthrobacter]MCC9144806.1 YtxH domain-containing protein [Arthrobacter sp. zg-Y919]MDK1276032.1 YtxH domain-containing protein [Arthrobacter sp. zg.Y919]WIB02621.1 YtxH domain-containing protein [Arthrobacter sp. zg-Y919]
MVKKLVFLAGAGIGYLAGSKGGREKLMQLWNDPKVQETVSHGTEWAKDKAPGLQDKVTGVAKDAASKVTGSSSSSSTDSSSTGSTGSSTGSSAAGGTGTNGSYTTGGEQKMSPAEPQPEA